MIDYKARARKHKVGRLVGASVQVMAKAFEEQERVVPGPALLAKAAARWLSAATDEEWAVLSTVARVKDPSEESRAEVIEALNEQAKDVVPQ